MAATNNLVLSLQLDSQEFQQQLNNERHTIKKWASDISRETGRMLKAVAVAPLKIIKDQLFSIKGLMISTFSLAGVGAFFKATSDGVKEMQKMARISHMTTDEFQKLSFAASTVGVEAEKVSDFMNDALLKINEYIREGSGEGANIVKMLQQAGLSLKEIENLHGESLFDAISDSAQKTGIDVETLTRYLDELASDPAVELSGIFTYDRAKFKSAMKDFDELGIVLDDSLLRKSDETRSAWIKLMAIIEKFSQIYYASLGPVLTLIGTHLTTLLTETAKSEGGFKSLGLMLASNTVGAIKDAIGYIRELIGSFKYGMYQIQEIANTLGADVSFVADPFKAQKKSIDELTNKQDEQVKSLKDAKKALKEYDVFANRPTFISGDAFAKKYSDNIKQLQQNIIDAKNGLEETGVEIREANDELELLKSDLTAEAFTPKMGTVESSMTDIKSNIIEELRVVNKASEETAEKQKKSNDEVVEHSKTSYEQIKQNISDSFTQGATDSVKKFGSTVEDEFMNMANGAQFSFKNMANSIIQDIQRMIIKALIMKPIMESIGAVGSSFGGPVGNAILEGTKGMAMGGPSIGGKSIIVGENGPELFTPDSSGRITPNGKYGGNEVRVNIINNSGEEAQTETREDGGDKVVDVIIGQAKSSISDDISRGTGLAKVLEGQYGLNRRSY